MSRYQVMNTFKGFAKKVPGTFFVYPWKKVTVPYLYLSKEA